MVADDGGEAEVDRIGSSNGEIHEEMMDNGCVVGELKEPATVLGLSSRMSSDRPRPVAKRDWPPGCGPRRDKKRQEGENGVAVARRIEDSDAAAVMQTDGRMDSESGFDSDDDDGVVRENKEKNEGIADGMPQVQVAETQGGTLEESVMEQGDTGVTAEEKHHRAEKSVDRKAVAQETDGVSDEASKPVAMKSVMKRKPSLNKSQVKDAQVSRPVAQKSTLQGAAKYRFSLAPEVEEQLSQQNDREAGDGEGAEPQRLKIKQEGSLQKSKKKVEDKPKDTSKKGSGVSQKVKSVKKDSHVKRKKESENSKPKTPSQSSPVPLVEKAGSLEDGETDIARLINDPHDPEARELVRKTLRTFDALRRKLMRDEENVAKQTASAKRSDLKAGTLMNEKKLSVNRVKKLGYVPGVEVGDHFYFRMELCIVGLHRQIQGGIDYISGKERENEWGHHVAASITASGGYEDDIDDGETLVYTGQGGNNYKGDKRQQVDQKLERGNLAMENSCRLGLPVRVIRGCKDKSSPSGTIYTYDGLYMVKESWLDKGVSGFGVYKFKLQRIYGQPQLGSVLVKFVDSLKSKPSKRESVIIEDISKGQEKIAVCVVNEVDDTSPVSETFQYITSVSFPEGFDKPSLPVGGCDCKKSCSSSNVCECIQKNGQKAPYIYGMLVEAKNVVYECGFQCGCPPTCHNRVTQHGIKHRLEVFKTKQKGWGVRSWDSIPSGSFICEYIGEVIDEVAETKLAIDASNYGNVGRFINHSCSPNLFAQCVLFDHHDVRIPHIMLFAMENIPPLTELTYDYGYTVGQVMDSDGNPKVKICHCGEKNCRGRMY
ncbi:hypothetical protein O6H91_22G037200 [Diphasiastrum complanatum]|uniref:Uncharacterized protein n=1 Tax=Diphasiastrum complanatum TaxID=34168 RepID=A0ACC2AEV1_DIPCM|nr:hypothetical protein O6H91_22G037200 [Diphasiastrum complanatum]